MSLNARDGVTHYITWSTREDGIRSKLLGVNFHNILQTFNIQVTRKTSIIMLVLWLSLPIRGFFLSGVLSLLSNWSWKNDFPQEKTEELTGFHLFLLSIMPWSQKNNHIFLNLFCFIYKRIKLLSNAVPQCGGKRLHWHTYPRSQISEYIFQSRLTTEQFLYVW